MYYLIAPREVWALFAYLFSGHIRIQTPLRPKINDCFHKSNFKVSPILNQTKNWSDKMKNIIFSAKIQMRYFLFIFKVYEIICIFKNYKVVQFWENSLARSYLSFISAFPHFECKITWVERCETKPSSSFFLQEHHQHWQKRREIIFTLCSSFFSNGFLFNFFEVTKDFQAKEKMMGTAESQKALFIVVTTTAGKEIF